MSISPVGLGLFLPASLDREEGGEIYVLLLLLLHATARGYLPLSLRNSGDRENLDCIVLLL